MYNRYKEGTSDMEQQDQRYTNRESRRRRMRTLSTNKNDVYIKMGIGAFLLVTGLLVSYFV